MSVFEGLSVELGWQRMRTAGGACIFFPSGRVSGSGHPGIGVCISGDYAIGERMSNDPLVSLTQLHGGNHDKNYEGRRVPSIATVSGPKPYSNEKGPEISGMRPPAHGRTKRWRSLLPSPES